LKIDFGKVEEILMDVEGEKGTEEDKWADLWFSRADWVREFLAGFEGLAVGVREKSAKSKEDGHRKGRRFWWFCLDCVRLNI
jgi:hypothetical protein